MKTFRVLFLLGLVAIAGLSCDDDDDNGPAPAPALPLISFGAPYQIVDDAEVLVPKLVGDSLRLGLAYSGCSDGHVFELRSRVLNSTRAEVWLFKITDEACLAFFQESRTFRVPQSALEKENILLVGPDFNSYILR